MFEREKSKTQIEVKRVLALAPYSFTFASIGAVCFCLWQTPAVSFVIAAFATGAAAFSLQWVGMKSQRPSFFLLSWLVAFTPSFLVGSSYELLRGLQFVALLGVPWGGLQLFFRQRIYGLRS